MASLPLLALTLLLLFRLSRSQNKAFYNAAHEASETCHGPRVYESSAVSLRYNRREAEAGLSARV